MTDEEEKLEIVVKLAEALVKETEDGWSATAKRIRGHLKTALENLRTPHPLPREEK